MIKRILYSSSVAILLVIGGIITYFSIQNRWNLAWMSLAIFLFATLYILWLERIIPLKQNWSFKRKEAAIDVTYLVSTGVFDAIAKTAALWFITFIYSWLKMPAEIWEKMPFVVAFILANIAGEFLPYLYHRISHYGKVNSTLSLFLWKTHSIHHLPETMNWFKTSWMHPLNMFVNTLLKYGTLLLLGFDTDIVFSVGVAHVLIAYISHANIKTTPSVLDYIVVTPRIHHFHHSKKMYEAKNYGNILPFWDLVFGTYFNRAGEVEDVGVTQTSYAYPTSQSYFKQILFPFLAVRNCCVAER